MAGSLPGERRGGRKKGTPNKRTSEMLERRRLEEEAARAPDAISSDPRKRIKKLGKDVLEEFMAVFAGMAAAYQPAPPSVEARPGQDEQKFKEYAKLAVDTAAVLA